MMNNISFNNPELLYLLVLLLGLVVWYYFKHNKTQASLQLSSLKAFENTPKTFRYYLRHLLVVLRFFAVGLLIVALARPQEISNEQETSTEGIDIMLTLDISSSMLAQDFDPNRLEASKKVAQEFISGRPQDRIGLAIFSGESFTQCPLTADHALLMNLFNDVNQGLIEDGTAIGLGLATAVNRLKDSKAKSKVIILLTDGVNNMGEISPSTAADLAKEFGIRVYTIGVGKNGTAPYPVQTVFGLRYQDVEVKIDEKTLKEISSKTDGEYFRATNNATLKEIYQTIDKLEKSKISVKKYSHKEELFLFFVSLAFLLLIFELVLKGTILKTIP